MSGHPVTMRSTGDSGWTRLEGRDNALNALRLVLAAMVLTMHAWQLPTGDYGPLPYLGSVAVDGFFVVSGFLIAGSRSRMGFAPFVWRRLLRIMPGFWACLLVTAFAIVPLSALLRGVSMDWSSAAHYVASNAALAVQQKDIGGLLTGQPFADWNSPLWTLPHEFRAYLIAGVLLAVARWRRATSWALLAVSGAGFWCALLMDVGPDLGAWRLLAFFAAGMVWRFEAPRVRLTAGAAALCAVLLAGLWALGAIELYVALAPLPMAYLILWLGASLPVRAGSRNDVSFGVYIYGAPVQQLMVSAGVAGLMSPWVFAAVSLTAVLPFAWASWLLVERPAMRARRRLVVRHSSGVIPATTVHDPSSSFTFNG